MKISNEVRVGILVTIALASLIWGLNYLKGKDFFTTSKKFYAIYDNVDGLVRSNPVIMSGFRIGIIKKIDFTPDKSGKLIVTMLINNDVFVSKDAKANIYSSDFLGSKAMRLDLGNDKNPAEDGDTLASILESSLTSKLQKEVGPVRGKVESLVVSLDSTTTMLRELFNSDTKHNLRSSITHLNNSLGSIDNMINNDNGKLKLMLENLESISSNFRQHNKEISNVIDHLSQLSDSLARTHFVSAINNADLVMAKTSLVMDKINKGEGSLGLLINDEQLYQNLDKTAKDLDELLKDLKANPKRYVHLSVFGKK